LNAEGVNQFQPKLNAEGVNQFQPKLNAEGVNQFEPKLNAEGVNQFEPKVRACENLGTKQTCVYNAEGVGLVIHRLPTLSAFNSLALRNPGLKQP